MQKLKRLWPLLLPVLVILPSLADFPYPPTPGSYSDLPLAYYPYTAFIRKALLTYHQLPLWSSNIFSGAPLAANPLAGMWYLPGWIAQLFPLPLGFNLLIALHLLWGGVGMYRLLRVEGLSYQAALLGATAFAAMPKLYAQYGGGHLSFLYAIPWTPWLLWAAGRKLFYPSDRYGLLEGIILGMIALADVRWAAYAGSIWLAYLFTHRQKHLAHSNWTVIKLRGYSLLQQTGLAALISAPLAIPLLEFSRLSTRSSMTAEDFFTFSLPAPRLLGLIFPDFAGFFEWVLYPGGAVLILSLLAVLLHRSLPGARFWAWAAAISLAFSLGSLVPGMTFLAQLPGFDLLRVPSRALFLSGLSLTALAGHAVHRLLAGVQQDEHSRIRLLLTAMMGLALLIAMGVWFLTGSLALNFAWGVGIILLGTILINLRLAGCLKANNWFAVTLVLCLVDLGVVDLSLFSPHPASMVYAEGGEVAQFLIKEPGAFRVYSPSYSLPQQTVANYGLQLADGVDPLQLQSYVDFMQRASGVPWTGYSVTLPPFAGGDPRIDNLTYKPDLALLGLLNVRFVASEYDVPVEGLVLRSQFGSTRLYENMKALPRAWVQPAESATGERVTTAELESWTPNRIVINASGPGLLVLSEIVYPGWKVWVDGSKAEIQAVENLLRAVSLGSGQHQIVFSYRPMSVYLGVGMCILALGFLGFQQINRCYTNTRSKTGKL